MLELESLFNTRVTTTTMAGIVNTNIVDMTSRRQRDDGNASQFLFTCVGWHFSSRARVLYQNMCFYHSTLTLLVGPFWGGEDIIFLVSKTLATRIAKQTLSPLHSCCVLCIFYLGLDLTTSVVPKDIHIYAKGSRRLFCPDAATICL